MKEVDMLVRDIMTRDVATVSPSTSVATIAHILLERRISAVPVLDQTGRIVGIVSEGDLLRRVEVGTEPHPRWWEFLIGGSDRLAGDYIKSHGRRAADVMTRKVYTIAEDAPLAEIAELLETRRIKRVPVVQGGRLVGIVSRSDLVRALIGAVETARDEGPVDDAVIQERVIATLHREPWANPERLNVVVSDGVVQLWGLVGSDDERQAYGIAAASIAGVKKVENQCGVISPSIATA
jgi:CBS domain-containing protein